MRKSVNKVNENKIWGTNKNELIIQMTWELPYCICRQGKNLSTKDTEML